MAKESSAIGCCLHTNAYAVGKRFSSLSVGRATLPVAAVRDPTASYHWDITFFSVPYLVSPLDLAFDHEWKRALPTGLAFLGQKCMRSSCPQISGCSSKSSLVHDTVLVLPHVRFSPTHNRGTTEEKVTSLRTSMYPAHWRMDR